MENLNNILVPKQQLSEIASHWYKELLSDQQIYSILGKTQKLDWCETHQDVFYVISDIIHRVYSNLKKTPKYDPDTMRKLSTRQLLTEKEVFFMNTCLEYSFLILHYMKEAWFSDVNLVVNELKTPDPLIYKLHFGLEWTHNNIVYYVDQKGRNTVNIGVWKFVSDYGDINESIVNTAIIPWKIIWFDDIFPDLHKKWIIDLKYFSPQLLNFFKEKFKQDNTLEERQNWFIAKVEHPEKPEIKIKNNIN